MGLNVIPTYTFVYKSNNYHFISNISKTKLNARYSLYCILRSMHRIVYINIFDWCQLKFSQLRYYLQVTCPILLSILLFTPYLIGLIHLAFFGTDHYQFWNFGYFGNIKMIIWSWPAKRRAWPDCTAWLYTGDKG